MNCMVGVRWLEPPSSCQPSNLQTFKPWMARVLTRRLIEAFGSMKSLVSGDWRTLEERIKDWDKTHPDRPIRGLGHVKCLELAVDGRVILCNRGESRDEHRRATFGEFRVAANDGICDFAAWFGKPQPCCRPPCAVAQRHTAERRFVKQVLYSLTFSCQPRTRRVMASATSRCFC